MCIRNWSIEIFSPPTELGTFDKYLYLSSLLWSKTTLIPSRVGEEGADPPPYKMMTIFICSWLLDSVQILNKQSYRIRTRTVEAVEVSTARVRREF